MNILPDLCPACLIELPEGYQFDHVRIDRAIGGDVDLFRSMPADEKREVVMAGRARGLTDHTIGERVAWTGMNVTKLMGETASPLNDRVTELWDRGLTDSAISLQVGCHYATVFKVRKRLGLAAKHGPGGQRKAGATV